MRRALAALLAALALLLALPAGAAAQDDASDDVVILVGPATIAEPVAGSVVVFSGGVRVASRVGGDVVVFSGSSTFAPTARVAGDVRWGETRPVVAPGAQVGGRVERLGVDEPVGEGFGLLGAFLFWLAFSVTTLVLGLVLLALLRRRAESIAAALRIRVGATIGWGIGIAVALPIVAVLAILTLFGIPLGIAILLGLFPLYLVAYCLGGWAIGRRLLASGPPIVAFLVGWALLRALALVPVLGGLAAVVATVVGLGAAVVAARSPRPLAGG